LQAELFSKLSLLILRKRIKTVDVLLKTLPKKGLGITTQYLNFLDMNIENKYFSMIQFILFSNQVLKKKSQKLMTVDDKNRPSHPNSIPRAFFSLIVLSNDGWVPACLLIEHCIAEVDATLTISAIYFPMKKTWFLLIYVKLKKRMTKNAATFGGVTGRCAPVRMF